MQKTRINQSVLSATNNNSLFRKRFDEWIMQIPNGPGSCIIIGYIGQESKIIDLVKSNDRLKKALKVGLKNWEGEFISRYLWIQRYMRQHGYKKLAIQLLE
jgi:hypothetical protein